MHWMKITNRKFSHLSQQTVRCHVGIFCSLCSTQSEDSKLQLWSWNLELPADKIIVLFHSKINSGIVSFNNLFSGFQHWIDSRKIQKILEMFIKMRESWKKLPLNGRGLLEEPDSPLTVKWTSFFKCNVYSFLSRDFYPMAPIGVFKFDADRFHKLLTTQWFRKTELQKRFWNYPGSSIEYKSPQNSVASL